MFFDGRRISRNRSRILKTAFDGLLAADQKQNKTKPNRNETTETAISWIVLPTMKREKAGKCLL